MKHVIITLALLFTFIFGSAFGLWLNRPAPEPIASPVPYPTGEQVLAELQKYRASQNLPQFELSPVLCDNIAERWDNYVKNNSHEGFQDFVDREYPSGFTASEILVAGITAPEMVEKWRTSPSHNYYLTHNSKICVYSSQGSSVAILSN